MPPINLLWDENNVAHLWQSRKATLSEPVMRITKKMSREEMIKRHESGDYDNGGPWQVVTVKGSALSPISLRLSRPLLDALDRLAERQHRKRSNLIQHILWEYVHSLDKAKP